MISRYFNLTTDNSWFLLGPRQTGKNTYIKGNHPVG